MLFTELELPGIFLIEHEEHRDERGYFARTYCAREFAAHGIIFEIKQCNLSWSPKKGTLRGLHYQNPPHAECKFISCVKGSIFDCVVDVRKDSPTYLRHTSIELHAFGPELFIPEGFAHGFQTLEDNTIVEYKVSAFYAPEAEVGMRWDDPRLGIAWPACENRIVSAKDAGHPFL